MKKKKRLIAQLLDYTLRTPRSMKTAQPGIIRGKNNRMFVEYFCAAVHVLDVYIACREALHDCCLSMRWKEIRSKKQKVALKHEML